MSQNIIGRAKCCLQGHFFIDDFEEAIVRNDDEGINLLFELVQPIVGNLATQEPVIAQRVAADLQRFTNGQGFLSFLLRYPEENFTVVVLANAAAPPPGLTPVSLAHEITNQLERIEQ